MAAAAAPPRHLNAVCASCWKGRGAARHEPPRGCSRHVWTLREIEDVRLARVKALRDEGLTIREIAEETGIPKSTVDRLNKRIKAEAAAGDARDDVAQG